jgi:hypothetical protein
MTPFTPGSKRQRTAGFTMADEAAASAMDEENEEIEAEIDLSSYKRDEWDLDEDLCMRQKEK